MIQFEVIEMKTVVTIAYHNIVPLHFGFLLSQFFQVHFDATHRVKAKPDEHTTHFN